MTNPTNDLIEAIPPAKTVRDRLAQTLRDAQLLRALLKASEAAERALARQGESNKVKGAGLCE